MIYSSVFHILQALEVSEWARELQRITSPYAFIIMVIYDIICTMEDLVTGLSFILLFILRLFKSPINVGKPNSKYPGGGVSGND